MEPNVGVMQYLIKKKGSCNANIVLTTLYYLFLYSSIQMCSLGGPLSRHSLKNIVCFFTLMFDTVQNEICAGFEGCFHIHVLKFHRAHLKSSLKL